MKYPGNSFVLVALVVVAIVGGAIMLGFYIGSVL
jgi:hypothetical protein